LSSDSAPTLFPYTTLFRSVAEIERALDLRALLRRLPAELRDLGVFLDVLGLEVVAPEDVDVVLRELGPLFLDDDRSSFEQLVVRSEEHTSELQSPDHLVCC